MGPIAAPVLDFGDASPGFQSQDGPHICELSWLHAMGSDLPLVGHLLMTGMAATFFTHWRLTCSMDRQEWGQHPVYADSVRSRTLMCDLLEMNSTPVVTSSCGRHGSHANVGNGDLSQNEGNFEDLTPFAMQCVPKKRDYLVTQQKRHIQAYCVGFCCP